MIVVFKSPPEVKAKNMSHLTYVKRVVGLPGECIRIVNSKVYINGKPIDEPYANFKSGVTVPINFPPDHSKYWWKEFPYEYRDLLVKTEIGTAFRIPEGHYFCMGDNRNLSADSRVWGPLPAEFIIGKPWRNYWSYEQTTQYFLKKDFFSQAKDFVLHFFTKTRWKRILKKF